LPGAEGCGEASCLLGARERIPLLVPARLEARGAVAHAAVRRAR